MISWFNVGEWLTGAFVRFWHPETTLAIKHAAKELGTEAKIKGEDALILVPPFGLLLYIGGPDLQPYCCVFEEKKLNLDGAKRLPFHQHGEALRRNSWVWFPRIDELGATSYEVQRTKDGSYVWLVNRVLPAAVTRSEARSRKHLVRALGSRLALDFRAYQEKLAEIP